MEECILTKINQNIRRDIFPKLNLILQEQTRLLNSYSRDFRLKGNVHVQIK